MIDTDEHKFKSENMFRKENNTVKLMTQNSTMEMDMTHGPLVGNILRFSLPLMATNLLQLLFNAADVIVVGQCASHRSLGAVGCTSSTILLVTNLLIGLSVGVNVLVAQNFGKGNSEERISKILHTSVLIAVIGGILLGAVGIILSRWILTVLDTPDDIFSKARIYMCIYFVGTPFMMIYNYGAAALRAAGDTKRPLIFLTLSGVVNVLLNLLFVITFRLDVAGVAMATVIGQILSAFLIMRCLIKSQGALHFSVHSLKFDRHSFGRILAIGLPAGLQSCLFSLSNMIIQGAINSYNSITIAASSASVSIEGFLYTATNAFSLTAQTFVGQNLGAGNYKRIRSILRVCITCAAILSVVLSTVVFIFAPFFIRIYNGKPDVIAQGVYRLHIVVLFYILLGIGDTVIGGARGAGYSVTPMLINLIGTCVFRIIWISLIDVKTLPVGYVYVSYPISWFIVMIAVVIMWFVIKTKWRRKKLL